MKAALFKGILITILGVLGAYVSTAQTVDIWPGDLDNNGKVDNIDYLYLGRAYGIQGPARNDSSLVWATHTALMWSDSLPDSLSTNLVYVDANGDGFIDDNDTTAIILNYGLTHGTYLGNRLGFSSGNATDPPLYLANKLDTVAHGQSVDMYCTLGSPSYPVDSFFGLAFTLNYDTTLVKSSSIMARLDTRWVDGSGGVLFFQHNYPDLGKLDIALSLKNFAGGFQNLAAGGYGNIIKFSMVIEDNVIGVAIPAPFSIERPVLIDHNMRLLRAQTMVDTLVIIGRTTGISEPTQPAKANIYPNPTTGQLIVDMGNVQANSISLYNIIGSQVMQTQPASVGKVDLNLNSLPNGMYIIRIETGQGMITKKVMINR